MVRLFIDKHHSALPGQRAKEGRSGRGGPVHSYLVEWARNGNSGVRMTQWRWKQFLEIKTYLGGRTYSTYR